MVPSQPRTDLRWGPWRPRLAPWSGMGLVIDGLTLDAGPAAPADYTNDVLLTPEHRDAFFDLIDAVGLVVCKHVGGDVERLTLERELAAKGLAAAILELKKSR